MKIKSSSNYSCEQFLASNPKSNGFDYLHLVCKTTSLHPDFFRFIAVLFSPDFVERDGVIYLSEIFDERVCGEYKQSRMPDAEIQFWMNLVEVTGLFDELTTKVALDFAGALEKSWNLKLVSEFGEGTNKARVVHNEGTGEIFVTIGFASGK